MQSPLDILQLSQVNGLMMVARLADTQPSPAAQGEQTLVAVNGM
jgi:hypothetical protein